MNRQQKRMSRDKKLRHDDRALKRKKDIAITYIYDLIIEKAITPILKEQFGFGPVRIRRFMEYLGRVEIYSGMTRENDATEVSHEKIKRERLKVESYVKVWKHVEGEARDTLGIMGYGEKRLSRMFDPYSKNIMSWDKLFKTE